MSTLIKNNQQPATCHQLAPSATPHFCSNSGHPAYRYDRTLPSKGSAQARLHPSGDSCACGGGGGGGGGGPRAGIEGGGSAAAAAVVAAAAAAVAAAAAAAGRCQGIQSPQQVGAGKPPAMSVRDSGLSAPRTSVPEESTLGPKSKQARW